MAAEWGWSNMDISAMMLRVAARGERLEEDARDIVEQTAADGAAAQVLALELAETNKGRSRMSGAHKDPYGSTHPGRVSSGEMTDAVGSRTSSDGGRIVGSWGWEQPKEKYLEQEYGEEAGAPKIPPAHSLLTSFVETRETFIRRAQLAARGEDWRE